MNFDFKKQRDIALQSTNIKGIKKLFNKLVGSAENELKKFCKDILLSDEYKYIFIETGSSMLLFFLFSKIIEEEERKNIDYSKIYDSSMINSESLNMSQDDKILIVEDIITETNKVYSDCLLLEEKYKLNEKNISIKTLSVYRNIIYINRLVNYLQYIDPYKSDRIDVEWSQYRRLMKIITKFILNKMKSNELNDYEKFIKLFNVINEYTDFDCKELYYDNKSLRIDAMDPQGTSEFHIDFFPTISLEKFKDFLNNNGLLINKKANELSEFELKTIFDFIMLHDKEEWLLKGYSIIYNLDFFNYEKFSELNITASSFDELRYDNDGLRYNCHDELFDCMRRGTHPDTFDIFREFEKTIQNIGITNEQGPIYINKNFEPAFRNQGIPLYDIVYSMKECNYPEKCYFLIMCSISQLYNDNMIEIKSNIFSDANKTYIGPVIKSNTKINYIPIFIDQKSFNYRLYKEDFEYEKQKKLTLKK